MLLALAGTARAATYTITVQSQSSSSDDADLREESPTSTNGGSTVLRLKAGPAGFRRNLVLDIPLPNLAGMTVLDAWLRLTQSGANSADSVESRLYPLLESWDEPDVSWIYRKEEQRWTQPGGTHSPEWVGRAFASAATNGTQVSWPVGPLIASWQMGTVTNRGMLIRSESAPTQREMVFRSSEYTTAPLETPQLVIRYTDERPAVRSGGAEVQPRAVRSGDPNAAIVVWLDVDAAGSTPSGQATGFDRVSIRHGNALVPTGIDSITAGGIAVSPGAVSWIDDGDTLKIAMPRVASATRIGIALRAKVTSGPTTYPLELPVRVDDSATPSVAAQSLWPRNSDGIAGNGDDWLLAVAPDEIVSIDLTADSTTVVNTTCMPLHVTGTDLLGETHPITADSITVSPAAFGSIGPGPEFCAVQPGMVTLIAHYGSLRDTLGISVVAARLPNVTSIALLDRNALAATALAPLDTMFLSMDVRDGDGFLDIAGLDIELSFAGHSGAAQSPAFRALARWRRGAVPAWSLADPSGSSWSVVPSLCAIDAVTNSPSNQTVRLAFVTSRVARASALGEWSAAVTTISLTPPDSSTFRLDGLGCRTHLEAAALDAAGAFNGGRLGALHLPLATPLDGRISTAIVANTPYALESRVTDMAGQTISTDTLRVGSPARRVSWAFNSSGSGGGLLDTAYTDLAAAEPALVTESPVTHDVHLWIDLPATGLIQSYTGRVETRARAVSGGERSGLSSTPLTATVLGAGQAASSALAEIAPNAVTVGEPARVFDVYLRPDLQLGDTGINRVLVLVPPGYGTPAVSGVRVGGLPVAFTDSSVAGMARAALALPVLTSSLVQVTFSVATPTALDSSGSDFVTLFDDAGTTLGPQAAVEGDASGSAGANSWMVTVGPGPLAVVRVSPDSLVCTTGAVTPFTAIATDAWGHGLAAAFTWSTFGGIGTVDAAGTLTAIAAGNGGVVASSGGRSDTAWVKVYPPSGIAVRRIEAPPTAYQGQPALAIRARLRNTGGRPVVLDTVSLVFTRIVAGDANAEFPAVRDPGSPQSIAPGDTAWIGFHADVDPDAVTGTVWVDARAVATEAETGAVLVANGSGSPRAIVVAPGGIVVGAQQQPRVVRPGESDVPLFAVTLDNQYPEPRVLSGLTLENRSSGPGKPELLDAELGELALYLDDGDGQLDPRRDVRLSAVVPAEGVLSFAPLSLDLAAGARTVLLVGSSPALASRDGDVLDLFARDSASAGFDAMTRARNSWPLDPSGGFPVNGMVAAQVHVDTVGPANLLAGSTRGLGLAVVLPPNGYEDDVLTRLGVANLGTARPDTDLTSVEAWADDGDRAFDSARDRRLGTMVFTGNRWEITGLDEPIPAGGQLVFVTVNVNALAEEGRTVRLALPAGADPGVGMSSGDDGPLDRAVENPYARALSTADRITLSAAALPAADVAPGQTGVTLLHFVASNSYAATRTLTELSVTNATEGPGTAAERDREIETLALRADGNGNGLLDGPAVDPVLGTGYFNSGRATFTGLDWTLAPGGTGHLFVTADVSRTGAADGDRLGASVAAPGDLSFDIPVSTAAAWPLAVAPASRVDGMTAAQITNLDSGSGTLAPGEGPALALDLIVPRNGYAADVLRGVQVVNLGSAGVTDIAELHLWRDGGDGAYSGGGGDDVDLGAMVRVGSVWQSALLAQTLGASGARLFVGATVAAAPADSVTLRLAVPVSGIAVESANDGPNDAPVASASPRLISTLPLLASLETATRSSTVGWNVTLRMIVRNAGAETLLAVTPTAPAPSGSAVLTPIGGPLPASVDLPPGAADTLAWVYRADGAGDVKFAARASGTGATSGTTRTSLEAVSPLHRVFLSVDDLEMFAVQSMPPRVSRGEHDVVPFSLTLTNPAGADASNALVRALRVRIESETGAPIVPAQLIARAIVNEGVNVYLTKTAIETSGSELDLTLAAPVTVSGIEPATLSLRLDISDTTNASSFRVVIPDSSDVTAEDATSGAPVTVRVQGGSYPIRSGVARIVAAATRLDVVAGAATPIRAGRGAAGVPLLDLTLGNPGIAGVTSDVRASAIVVTFEDTLGNRIANPAARVSRLKVATPIQTVTNRALSGADSASVRLDLSPALSIPAGSTLPVTVSADLADSAALGTFRLSLRSAADVDARDADTQDTVAVFLSPDPLAGGPVTVEAVADSLRFAGTPRMPASVALGSRDVLAMSVRLRHPGTAGTARIRVDSLRVRAHDEARRPLALASLLSGMRIEWNGAAVAVVSAMPGGTGGAVIPLPGATLSPADTAEVRLIMDVSPLAGGTYFELEIAPGGLGASDANLGTAVLAAPEAGADPSLVSGLARLAVPPRELDAGLASLMPATLASDRREVPFATLHLVNPAAADAGAIGLDGLVIRASDRDGTPVAAGATVERVIARVGAAIWAQSAALTPDSLTATLPAGARLDVMPGAPVDVALSLVTRADPSATAFRLGLEAAGFGVIQPGSAALDIQARPAAGQSFPLWSDAGGYAGADLASSWSNFPNPFAAGRDVTSFVFYLRSPARVTLRVWTPRSERVVTLLDGAARGAGLYQSDRWDGRNGAGQVVRNGVYVAELEVAYEDGGSERVTRKVAVVR